MTRYREAALRRTCQMLFLLFGLALATTGCTLGSNNTSNNISGDCNGIGNNNSAGCAATTPAGPSAAASIRASNPSAPARSPSGVPAGKKLGEYTITLPEGTYVPVGPNPPTRSQESPTPSPSTDLEFYVLSGVSVFLPNNPFSTIAPFSGGIPSYQGCQADLDTQSQVGANQGSAFCLYEKQPARTVGGIVTATQASAINPDEIEVQFTIWNGTS